MTTKIITSIALLLASLLITTTTVASPIFQADISANLVRPANGTGSVFYSQSNNLPPAPTASGFGGVNNSLGQDDPNSYGGSTSGSQTYGAGVSWGGGTAESSVGTPFTFPLGGGVNGTAWGGATADANLLLDLTGAPIGSSVEGLANAAVGGYAYDGSDTAGVDGKYTFNVEFTIDALLSGFFGSNFDGAVGIQVDVFNFTTGDLVSDFFNPRVGGTGINGTVDMTEETRIDGQGDAWTFSLTAADILGNGGSINGSYTAEFDFLIPDDLATANSIYLNINAFALGEATAAVPEPTTMLLFGIGLLGLAGANRRKK